MICWTYIATDTAKMTISSLAVIIIYLRLVIDMNMCTIILYPPYPPCNVQVQPQPLKPD